MLQVRERAGRTAPGHAGRGMRRTLVLGWHILFMLVLLWPTSTFAASTVPAPAGAPGAAWPAIALAPVVTGLNKPVAIVHAGDRSGRLFIVEQAGTIRIARGGVLQDTPFLDITGSVSCCGERGLLGLAFPPGYATKRHFYVYYTDVAGNLTVARYAVGADPDRADASTAQVLLSVPHPGENHNGGQLAFGPGDGYLYIGLGDGGGTGDPNRNAQNGGALLGKILRIDVESGAVPYAVPPTNPFLARPNFRPEVWALGLRNPWRFSFDRLTHDLYIADVGEGAWEEVDFHLAGTPDGVNYGWSTMEGAHCYATPDCNPAGLTPPATEYSHGQGCAVTGGYNYRGSRQPRLAGIYFFGDFCSGRLWGLRFGGRAWEIQQVGQAPGSISSFGEDEAGEIYVAGYGSSTIYRVLQVSDYFPWLPR